MPDLRNSYGDRAADLEWDRLKRRIQILESRPIQTANPQTVQNITNVTNTSDVSFVTLAKWEAG